MRALQDSEKAAAKSTLGSKGLGAGGAKKRLHIVAQETQRLQQVHDGALCTATRA